MDGDITINSKKPRNGWKAISVVFIVLTLVFAGASGFLGYQLAQKKTDLSDANSSIKDVKAQLKQVKKDLADAKKQNITGGTNIKDSTGYLTIKEWGIKFKIPDGLNSIRYEINKDSNGKQYVGVYYDDAGCSFPIVTISRTTNASTPASQDGTLKVGDIAKKIGDYYYTVAAMQANGGCTNDANATKARTGLLQILIGSNWQTSQTVTGLEQV